MMVKIISTESLRHEYPDIVGLDSEHSANDESNEQLENYLDSLSTKKFIEPKVFKKNNFNPSFKKRAP